MDRVGTAGEPARRAVLVGASVGNAWRVPELPGRIPLPGWELEFAGEYAFDKEKVLAGILQRKDRPQAVIIKECAAYFPGDLTRYRALMKKWVGDCRRGGVVPILATVAPVREPDLTRLQYWKNLAKRVLSAQPGVAARRNQIGIFNDWLRGYAMEEGISLLDLERALIYNPTNRSLRRDFDSGDGLHLNWRAYRELDLVLAATLKNLNRRP